LKLGAQIGNTCESLFPMSFGTPPLTSVGVIRLRSWAEQQPLETGERSVLMLKQSDQTKQ